MLKVKLTQKYAGLTIYGDYEDLNSLYDAISYLIYDDPNNIKEYMMQNHLYGFLYDVRHSYQGDRGIELINNNLGEYSSKLSKTKKKEVGQYNAYYYFHYPLPELLLDMLLIKYFIINAPRKENDIYNPNINIVKYLYSLILEAITPMLNETKADKLRKGFRKAIINDNKFIPQWFELITIDYLRMTKEQRQKKFMQIAKKIYNYSSYKEYTKLKLELEKECKKNNCTLDDMHYEDYPEEIDW